MSEDQRQYDKLCKEILELKQKLTALPEMGITNDLSEDAKAFLEENFRAEIDPLLMEMAGILGVLETPLPLLTRLAEIHAKLTAIAFKAGMEFEFQLGG